MKRVGHYLPPSFVFFVLFVVHASLMGCSPYAGERTYEEGSQLLEGLTFSEKQAGVPQWELKAPRGSLQDEKGVAELESPELGFYVKGKLASRATALGGWIDTRNRAVVLSTSVVLTSLEDGAVMRTDSLVYSSTRNLVYTDFPVDVKRTDGHLVGQGLEATPDLKEIRIKKQRTELNR